MRHSLATRSCLEILEFLAWKRGWSVTRHGDRSNFRISLITTSTGVIVSPSFAEMLSPFALLLSWIAPFASRLVFDFKGFAGAFDALEVTLELGEGLLVLWPQGAAAFQFLELVNLALQPFRISAREFLVALRLLLLLGFGDFLLLLRLALSSNRVEVTFALRHDGKSLDLDDASTTFSRKVPQG